MSSDSHYFRPVEVELLEQVREQRLGHGKAAELSGVPEARFIELMGRHGISPFDYDTNELDHEFEHCESAAQYAPTRG